MGRSKRRRSSTGPIGAQEFKMQKLSALDQALENEDFALYEELADEAVKYRDLRKSGGTPEQFQQLEIGISKIIRWETLDNSLPEDLS